MKLFNWFSPKKNNKITLTAGQVSDYAKMKTIAMRNGWYYDISFLEFYYDNWCCIYYNPELAKRIEGYGDSEKLSEIDCLERLIEALKAVSGNHT